MQTRNSEPLGNTNRRLFDPATERGAEGSRRRLLHSTSSSYVGNKLKIHSTTSIEEYATATF